MQNHSNNVNSETQTVEIQVVLEYSWDSHRDLIANVQAEQIVNESTQEPQFSFKSVVSSLAAKGFDLDPEHRISFKDQVKNLYVFIGKTSDEATLERFNIPKSAFAEAQANG